MKFIDAPAIAAGILLGLAASAQAQAPSQTSQQINGTPAPVVATRTKTAVAVLPTQTLWDPDQCAPEKRGGKHEWSPGDCGVLERYLSANWVALYQKNTSDVTGCSKWYWDYGKKDSCCGKWWLWEDYIICDAYGRITDSPWNDVIDFGAPHDDFKPPQYPCVPTNPNTGERPGPWSCIQSPKDHKNWIIARRVRGGASAPLDDVEGLVIENTIEGKGGFWSSTREGCLRALPYYVNRQISEPFRCSEGGYTWDPPHWCKTGRTGLPPPNDTGIACADGTKWTEPKYLPAGTNNSWSAVFASANFTPPVPLEIQYDPYNGVNVATVVYSTYPGATSRVPPNKKTTTTTETTTTTTMAAAITTTSPTSTKLPGIYITTTTHEESSAASVRLSIVTLFASMGVVLFFFAL